MKRTIFIIFIISSLKLLSQNYTISGYVYDIETNEKLVNATVYVKNNAVLTNEYGYFSLSINNLTGDTIVITSVYVGYFHESRKIYLRTTKTVNFYLKPNTQLDSVIVSGQIPVTKTTEIGAISIPMNQIKLMPSLGAESDIFKSLQLMPGVQAGNEGTSNLYVRGGSPEENLVLLDDVPLYYVNHLGGFISVFNTDALSYVKMYKGGFPARFGSRLSSVIDIRMKDGDYRKYKKIVSIGLIDTKFLIEGPIIKNKASFIVSARFLPLSFISKPISYLFNEGQAIAYNFYDINIKLNYRLNNNNQFYFSLYSGDDDFNTSNLSKSSENQHFKYDLIWGNRLFALRWNHIFLPKLYLNTILSYTRFRYDNTLFSKNKQKKQIFTYNFYSAIRDFSLKSILDYNICENYKLKLGGSLILHRFNPGLAYYKITSSDTIISDTNTNAKEFVPFETVLFVENNISFSNFFKANIGLHFSNYIANGKDNYLSYEPRIVLNFMLNSNYSIKISYSQMKQYVHLLSNNSIGINPDIWVPTIGNIKPANSKQISMGFFMLFFGRKIEFSIISYYKKSNNLIAYKEGAVFIKNAENWQNKIETNGTGNAYGIEVLLQKKQGSTTGWISYTYAKSMRQFKNINLGKVFPFKYDRRNDISIIVNHKINNNISISADWVYGSGYPYTVPVGHYNIISDEKMSFFYNQMVYVYSNRNTYRMRPYHRLDIAANFSKKIKKGVRIWTISIYNIYNRQNPYFYYTKLSKTDNKLHLYQQSLFPIIPSISYTIKF